MEFLALADLKENTKQEIIDILIDTYSGEDSGFDYGEITEADKEKAKQILSELELILAYEHVGNWGCDSSSFFVFKSKTNEDYFELHGGHCSCYGFEGQLKDIEKTTLKALKDRASKNNLISLGGYDDEDNDVKCNNFIMSLND